MKPARLLRARSTWARFCAMVSVAAAILAVSSAPVLAQRTGSDARRAHATRDQLEALAAEAERAATSGPRELRDRKRTEAAALRERLREGDFQVGDRMILQVHGEPTLTDSFTVRSGQVVVLPNLPEISVRGVLRAELQDYLTKQIGRYVRNPDVQATSLIRLAVLGSVQEPGFYSLPADVLISDAIMQAGGPSGEADVSKSVVKRAQREIWSEKAVQAAVTSGKTLDQLNLRAGDELLVGERSRRNWLTAVQAAGAVVGLVAGILLIASR